MHSYATDVEERRPIFFILVVLSIVCAWLLPRGLSAVSVAAPWWLEVPSVWGFFGLFYWLVNRVVWRWVSRIPNLNGVWHGHVSSSFDQYQTEHKVTLRIRQTWTKLQVSLAAEKSQSHSVMGAVLVDGSHGPELSYEYVNEPRPGAADDMHAHRGFVRAEIQQRNVLSGSYYTGRDRERNGILVVRRKAN